MERLLAFCCGVQKPKGTKWNQIGIGSNQDQELTVWSENLTASISIYSSELRNSKIKHDKNESDDGTVAVGMLGSYGEVEFESGGMFIGIIGVAQKEDLDLTVWNKSSSAS